MEKVRESFGTQETQTLPTAAIDPRASQAILSRLRALVLLGGSIRPCPISLATGRSVLDLPVTHGESILSLWLDAHDRIRRMLPRGSFPLRLLLDRYGPLPSVCPSKNGLPFRLERDPSEFRGTGGLLRDAAIDYEEDSYILVANAGQVLLEPLEELVARMAGLGGDVCLLAPLDGAPCCFLLLRCEIVRSIPAIGYVDFKEQALPAISKDYVVRVLASKKAPGLPVWSAAEYIRALTAYHSRKGKGSFEADPFAENWSCRFAIVEDGAIVEQDARLHDSVVLRGGHVKRRAIVGRSVVCAGGVVRAGQRVIDRTVA